jgi:preprotein translocase SecE subunit
VKIEASKVVWPSPKEVSIIVGLVLVVAAVAGLFFLVVD